MTIRYFPRYAGKEGFEERYELVDSRTGEVLSPPGPYAEVLEQVEARNNPVEAVEVAGSVRVTVDPAQDVHFIFGVHNPWQTP